MKTIKILIFFTLSLFVLNIATAQTRKKTKYKAINKVCTDCITAKEAANHIDETVKVKGRVAKVSSVNWETGEPVFLDLEKKFPRNICNVVVFKEAQGYFKGLKKLEGKHIIATGLVSMYHYKGNHRYPATTYPQIIIRDSSQLQILN